MLSLRDRIKEYLTCHTQVMENYDSANPAHHNSDGLPILKCYNTDQDIIPTPSPIPKPFDTKRFNVWWAMRDYPQAFIRVKVVDSFNPDILSVKIKKVEPIYTPDLLHDNGDPLTDGYGRWILEKGELPSTIPVPLHWEITLGKAFADPITNPTTIGVGSIIKRAPNYEEIREVYIGDPSSIPEDALPAICVMPDNKKVDWLTLQGTEETHNFSIITHVKEDNYQNCVVTLLRITQDLEDLLNADLHLKIKRRDEKTYLADNIPAYDKVNNSLCTNIDYGYSMKGTYCMSSKITWFGTEYWFRMHLVQNPETRVFE